MRWLFPLLLLAGCGPRECPFPDTDMQNNAARVRSGTEEVCPEGRPIDVPTSANEGAAAKQ